MYDKSLVDIKELNAIPPAELNTSYRYEPSKLKPPIGSNLLMHYFRCPEDAPSVMPCFRKMPKKMNQKLTVRPVRGVSPRWGLHFVEGWNWKKILTVSCFVFILARLRLEFCIGSLSTAFRMLLLLGTLCWLVSQFVLVRCRHGRVLLKVGILLVNCLAIMNMTFFISPVPSQ